ncbi:MAG: hypothetical protein ACNA8W_10625 [Bradymonadaceae bacterium]
MHQENAMSPAQSLFLLFSLTALIVAGCSSPTSTSCAQDRDCFAAESCIGGSCTLDEDNTAGGGKDATGGTEPDSNNNTGSTGDTEPNDGPDTTLGDSGSQPGEDADTVRQCSFSGSGQHSCASGHTELDGNQFLTLLPETMDEGGCELYGDPTRDFRHFEAETWTIRACPNRHHKFRFPLRRCVSQTYAAFVRIEPVDPVCSLEEFATIRLEEPFASYWEPCGDRDDNCYVERRLDSGGFEWVFKPQAPPNSPSYAWTVVVHVELEPDVYFEYDITSWIPEF